MSERIDLGRMRHWIEKRGADEQAPLTAGEALALVEAVEAAQAEADNRRSAGQEITARLSAAVARFGAHT